MQILRPVLFVALLGLTSIGCGGSTQGPPSEQDVQRTVLSDVAELYRVYQVGKNAPPKNVGDLVPYEQGAPLGLKAIKDGSVVVNFGATMPDTGEGFGPGGADEVLAYEKQVPESGGMVLMLNRSVKKMTSDEFKQAKKAGK